MNAPEALQSVEVARAAFELARYGGASIEAETARGAELLAARIAAETPVQTIARLEQQAATEDDAEARYMLEEASLAGRVARCRTNGNDALAEQLERNRVIQVKLALDHGANAIRYRAQAAIKRHWLAQAEAIRGVARPAQ